MTNFYSPFIINEERNEQSMLNALRLSMENRDANRKLNKPNHRSFIKKHCK